MNYYLVIIIWLFISLLPGFQPACSQNKSVMIEEFIFDQAPFKSCHASTIAESEGKLVVAFFGGTHEKHKDVEIWLCIKERGLWSRPVSIADGIYEGNRYPCWNPVLYQIPGGDLILFYKVGPDPERWWGMMKRSGDGGLTWTAAERLPGGHIGPVKNKPVLLKNGDLLCPSSTENDGWKVHMEITSDFGKTWEPIVMIDPMSEYQVIQPTILQHENGWLQILCRSQNGLIIQSLSTDQGKTWSVLEPIDLPNPNSGIDGVTLLNGTQLLAYNHSQKTPREWGGPRYPLNIAISEDGFSWKASLVLEDSPGEYSYPAIIQDSQGLVHVVYTYNREKIKHVVLEPDQLPAQSITKWNIER